MKTGTVLNVQLPVLVFLIHVRDKKEKLFLAEMKAEMKFRSAATNHLIPGGDFSRTWYFSANTSALTKS